MANESRVTSAELTAAGSKFDSGADGLDSMLRSLMGELQIAETAWVGAGGGSFDAVKRKFQEEQQQLHQALKQTAEAMRTSGTSYAATDAEANAALKGLAAEGSGPSLPL